MLLITIIRTIITLQH